MDRVKYLLNVVIIATLFSIVAISRDGRLLGHDITGEQHDSAQVAEETIKDSDIEQVLFDGTRVIHSAHLAKKIIGFNGPTPVSLYIKDDIIVKVVAEPNEETPSFFNRLIKRGLINSWDGKSLKEAAKVQADIISGATYSSIAVIQNVNRAIAYASDHTPSNGGFKLFDEKTIAGIIVILLGIALTFLRPKQKWWEVAYMLLNVGVLGFWCGSFLSLAQFTSWMANGASFSLTLMLLFVVILMPLLGRKGSYCHLHCPMGSAQELLSRVSLPQIKFSAKTNSILNNVRYYIFAILMLLMWVGVGFEIMDYEIFSAFFISSASSVVLTMAAIFLTLSLFTKRPYCRFICPTGAMITISQKTKG